MMTQMFKLSRLLKPKCACALLLFAAISPAIAQKTNWENVALISAGASVSANGSLDIGGHNYVPSEAIDGNINTYWVGLSSSGTPTLEVYFHTNCWISKIDIHENPAEASVAYVRTGFVDYKNTNGWVRLFDVSKTSVNLSQSFTPVKAQAVRFVITQSVVPGGWWNQVAGIAAFEVYGTTNAPVVIHGPANQQVPIGGTAIFSCSTEPTNYPGATYQWFFNGSPISRATNLSLTLPNATVFFEGEYQMRAVCPPYTLMSQTARLSVMDFAISVFTSVEIEFPTSAGKTYQVEASPDFLNWSKIGEDVPGTGQLIQRMYSTRGTAYRYFRAREL